MIHLVYANRSNAGDWLSARGIALLLAEPVTEHLCDDPFVEETLGNLARLGPTDLVVIGGGGLFHTYFTPFWQGLLGLPNRPAFCLWGVGLCDLKAEPSRVGDELGRAVAARSRLTVVRDELTREYLGGGDLPAPVPCPSLSAIERPEQAGFGLLHAVNQSTAGDAAVEAMRAAGRAFAERSGRIYRETSNRFEADDRRGLDRCLSLYGMSDVVLSSRLHGCLFAVAMGRKLLAVSGDWKIDAFLRSAGLADWLVDVRDLSGLGDRLARLDSQPDVSAFVARARARHREVAAEVRQLHASLA